MAEASQDIYQSLLDQVKAYESSIEAVEVGYVQEIGDGIARVTGLQNIRFSELVRFERPTRTLSSILITSPPSMVAGGLI